MTMSDLARVGYCLTALTILYVIKGMSELVRVSEEVTRLSMSSLPKNITAYLHQLSCRSTLVKAFHSFLDRSSTSRLLWRLRNRGCPCRNEQAAGDLNHALL